MHFMNKLQRLYKKPLYKACFSIRLKAYKFQFPEVHADVLSEVGHTFSRTCC